MKIADHVKEMRFELADMPETKVDGYLTMFWLEDHNADINWEKGSLKWRSNYCKAHCQMARKRLVFKTSEELLVEDPNEIYLLGMCRYTDKDQGDIKLTLCQSIKTMQISLAQKWQNLCPSTPSMIIVLNKEEGKISPSGPIYPLSRRELNVLY